MLNEYFLRDVLRLGPDNRLLPNVRLRNEILSGEIIPAPSGAIKHQAISLRIASALLQHVEASRLGRVLSAPCHVILSEKIVMQPDILFIRNGRRGLIGEMNLRGAPDLVIDVISTETHKEDLTVRRRIYECFEVREYWLVDPDEAVVETMIWSELGYISVCYFNKSGKLSSPLLPDLNLDLSRIFEMHDE